MTYLGRVLTRYRIVAAAIDRYLVMFPDDQRDRVRPAVQWALDTLKKQDRVVWFIKQYRRDAAVWDRHRAEFEHFHAMEQQVPQLSRYRFEDQKTPEALLHDLKEIERSALARKGDQLVGPKGDVIVDLGGGWAWWNLGVSACDDEAGAMGHCGNQPSKQPGDQLLSLRRQVKVGTETMYAPHLTFVLNHGVLGEMKGRANERPKAKYHHAIVELLVRDPAIKHLWGGGYQPFNNFQLTDLTELERSRVVQAKPQIDLQAPRKIDIDGIYPPPKEKSNWSILLPGGETSKHRSEFEQHNRAIDYLEQRLGDQVGDRQAWLTVQPSPDDPAIQMVPFIIRNAPAGPALARYLDHYLRLDGAPYDVKAAALPRVKDRQLLLWAADHVMGHEAEHLRAYAISLVGDPDQTKRWIADHPKNRYRLHLIEDLDDDYKIDYLKDIKVSSYDVQNDLVKIFDSLAEPGKKRLAQVTTSPWMRDHILRTMVKTGSSWMDPADLKRRVLETHDQPTIERMLYLVRDDQDFIQRYVERAPEGPAFNHSTEVLQLVTDPQYLKAIYLDKTKPTRLRHNALLVLMKRKETGVVTDQEFFKLAFDPAEDIRDRACWELRGRDATDLLVEIARRTRHKKILNQLLRYESVPVVYQAFRNRQVDEYGRLGSESDYRDAMKRLATDPRLLGDVIMHKTGDIGYDLIRYTDDPTVLKMVADQHPEEGYRRLAAQRLARETKASAPG